MAARPFDRLATAPCSFRLFPSIRRSGSRAIFGSNGDSQSIAGRIHEVREKISNMEMRLPADRFLRVHRSYLVNLDVVQELYPVGGGDYMIALRDGKELPVGATYPAAIRRALIDARRPRAGFRPHGAQ
jgi:hypothetical protein